jgi:hypothetical protein
MRGLSAPLLLLILCLGVVWFASTNSETVDGWFENTVIIDESSFKNEVSNIPEGSYYVVANSATGGSSEKITSGNIPDAKMNDMFIHKGYTYVYIVPQDATAIRYDLEGNQWYIYSAPAEGTPLTRIGGVKVEQKTLNELMQEEQDHVIGDEQQSQQPTQQPETVPPQSQGTTDTELDEDFYNDWSGSSGPSWGDGGNSGPSWGDSGSSGPSW